MFENKAMTGDGAQSAKYRKSDNYNIGQVEYRKSDSDYSNQISGKLKEYLGLGEYSEEKYAAILDGHFIPENIDKTREKLGRLLSDDADFRVKRNKYSTEIKKDKNGKALPLKKARIGMEMNYAPPKSVSAYALMYGKEDALQAHMIAVQKTNKWIEANLLEVRMTKKDIAICKAMGIHLEVGPQIDREAGMFRVKTDNAVIISCLHTVSRLSKSGDSGGQFQIHNHDVFGTHTLIGGKLRAIDWKNVYDNQHAIDAVYKSIMREELEARGIQCVETKKNGWEIAGFERNDIEAFSDASAYRIPSFIDDENRRRQDPMHPKHGDYLDPLNGKDRQFANSASRGAKGEIDLSQLTDEEQDLINSKEHADEHGGAALSLEALKAWNKYRAAHPLAAGQTPVDTDELGRRIEAVQKEMNEKPLEKRTAQKAVDMAIANLTATKSFIKSEVSLIQYALHFAQYQLSPGEIQAEIQLRVDGGEIFAKPGEYSRRLTTKEMLDNETECLKLFLDGVGTVKPLSTRELVTEIIDRFEAEKGFKLSNDQRNAVFGVCCSTSQTNLVLGMAGTGKSTKMEIIMRVAKAEGLQTMGYAPTHQAKNEIGESIHDKEEMADQGDNFKSRAFTIQKAAISSKLWEQFKPGDVVIIDECGLSGSKDLLRIQQRGAEAGVRLIFVGDYDQQHAVSPGSSFEMLCTEAQKIKAQKISAGEKFNDCFFVLAEMMRGKDEKTKTAHNLSAKNPAEAITFLAKNGDVMQRDDDAELFAAMGAEYKQLSEKARDNTYILTELNADRLEINKAVRKALGFDIALNSIEFDALNRVQLDESELQQSAEYEPGMIIQFNATTDGFQRGEKLTVKEVRGRTVFATREIMERGVPKTVTVEFDPELQSSTITLYQKEKMSVVVGERIRMTATEDGQDTKFGYKNGDRGVVTKLDYANKTATVKLMNGKSIKLDLDPKKGGVPTQYSYSITGYAAQGATAKSKGVGDKDAGRVMYHLTSKKPANFNKLYVGITRSTLDGVKIYMNAKGADAVNKLLKAAGKKGVYDRAGALDKASKERTGGMLVPNTFLSKDNLDKTIEFVKDETKTFLDQIKEASKKLGKEIGLLGSVEFGKKVVNEIVNAGLEKEIIVTNDKLQKYKDSCILERDEKIELEHQKLKEAILANTPIVEKSDVFGEAENFIDEKQDEPKDIPVKENPVELEAEEIPPPPEPEDEEEEEESYSRSHGPRM